VVLDLTFAWEIRGETEANVKFTTLDGSTTHCMSSRLASKARAHFQKFASPVQQHLFGGCTKKWLAAAYFIGKNR
jgi:hypothetical protein